MLNATWIGLFMPLVGFLILMASSSYIKRTAAGLIACATLLISFCCFAFLLHFYTSSSSSPISLPLYSWIPVKGINADFSLYLDPLSLTMTLVITGVGLFIHIYSIGYMDHDKDYARYFAFLNFFVFAMLLLVLAEHLLLLFVGWEGVGLASYLLIGFYYERPEAAAAATKAFVVNRIGDLGLLLGLLLTFHLFGTSNATAINANVKQGFAVGAPIIAILTLLYFIGATGKSAQLPLHVWLPDAMEGPTPVSALIHAATMVTAGVYLVVRMHAAFLQAPETMHVVGIIGAATALFAALCALAQTDLKRVLAYSTVSQLGYMFLACGVGAFYAAMFHLVMHAFVKALLFLSAGNIVHMMHGETQMARMGGLAKILRKTNWLFLIGVLALSGIPPLAAFFSKDLILDQAHLTGFYTLFFIGLVTAVLTAFYLTRAYFLTFAGKSHVNPTLLRTLHEAPFVMITPVTILAVLSVVGGFLGFAYGKPSLLESFLAKANVLLAVNEYPGSYVFTLEALISIIGAIAGVMLAAFLYTRYVDKLGSPIALLRNSFYVDQIYDFLFVRPLEALSRWINSFFEPKIFDGALTLAAEGSQKTAGLLQKVQSGQIRSYVAWMTVGAALLLVYFIL